MYDRVVDRAAEHGEPADLALRDWLLVGLSFSAGMYEAICFLTFGKVFAGFQTGNLMLLGVGIAAPAARWPEPGHGHHLPGRVRRRRRAGGADLKAFGRGEEGDEVAPTVHQVWPRRVSVAFAIGLIPQAAFLAVWITAASPASLSGILIALAALAMGLRSTPPAHSTCRAFPRWLLPPRTSAW